MKKKTLVLGASTNPSRYSYFAIQRLRRYDQPTVAIGLRKGTVEDVEIVTEKIPFKDVHTVTLYMSARYQEEYYDYILALNPERVIFNPGTENPDLYKLLTENGIAYENSCTLVMLSSQQY